MACQYEAGRERGLARTCAPAERANAVVGSDGGGMQSLATTQVYDEGEHLVDQEVTDSFGGRVARRITTRHVIPVIVDDEVGDSGEGKHISPFVLSPTKPRPAPWKSRAEVPSRTESARLNAIAQAGAYRRAPGRRAKRNQLGKRTISYNLQSVNAVIKIPNVLSLQSIRGAEWGDPLSPSSSEILADRHTSARQKHPISGAENANLHCCAKKRLETTAGHSLSQAIHR